jgi:hypothetical protein
MHDLPCSHIISHLQEPNKENELYKSLRPFKRTSVKECPDLSMNCLLEPAVGASTHRVHLTSCNNMVDRGRSHTYIAIMITLRFPNYTAAQKFIN